MDEPRPTLSPGARGARRLAAAAVFLLLAGFLVGYLAPESGGEGNNAPPPPTVPAPPRAATPPAAPLPAAVDLPALRAENEVLRTRVAALENASTRSADTSPSSAAPPLLPGAPPTATSAGTASLRVRVVDGAGAPVAGALVQTLVFRDSRAEDKEKTESDARGIADFAGLSPGRRRVGVYVRGFAVECDPRAEAGRTLEVVVPVEAGVSVSGVVRHAETGPLANVYLGLYRHEGPFMFNIHGNVDAKGRFRIEGVPPGPWSVHLSGGSVGASRQVAEIVVPEGRPLDQDIVLGVPRLWGTVRERGTGAPIPGARLGLSSGGNDQSVETDGAGGYCFLDILPGPHSFRVSRDGYGVRFLRGVDVPGGGRSLDIELTPAASLSFRVTSAGGGPFEGRLVLDVEPKDPEVGTRVSTWITFDGTGTGTCREITPGAYTLRFRMSGVGQVAVLQAEIPAGASTLDVRLAEK